MIKVNNIETGYCSVGDVVIGQNEQHYLVIGNKRQLGKNEEYVPNYIDVITKKYNKNKSKRIIYSKRKQNAEKILRKLQIIKIIHDNNGYKLDQTIISCDIIKMHVKTIKRYNNLNALFKDYPFNNKKISEMIDKSYISYSIFNKNNIPANYVIYCDKYSSDQYSFCTGGVCRLKWLDLPHWIGQKLVNCPILFLYGRGVDTIALAKVLKKILDTIAGKKFLYNGYNYIPYCNGIIGDSQEIKDWSLIATSNASIHVCSTCHIERIDILGDVIQNQYINDPDNKKINDNNNNNESIVEQRSQAPYKHIIQKYHLNNWRIPMKIDNVYCSGDMGWWELQAVFSKYGLKGLSKFGFKHPRVSLILKRVKGLLLFDITKWLTNDIDHNFSNISKQLYKYILKVCHGIIADAITSHILQKTGLKELIWSKISQSIAINMLQLLGSIMLIIRAEFKNCVFNPYVQYFQLISCYTMIFRHAISYDEYPLTAMSIIIYSFLLYLSKMSLKYKGASFLTSITIHQFISFNLTSIKRFDNLRATATGCMERGMLWIKSALRKTKHKNIQYLMDDYALLRETYRVITCDCPYIEGIEYDVKCKFKYVWDPFGPYKPDTRLQNVQYARRILNMDGCSNQMIPCGKIKNENNIRYWTSVRCDYDWNSEMKENVNGIYAQTRRNEWRIKQFYEIKYNENDVIARLDDITTNENNKNIKGKFRIFYGGGTVQNGYKSYAETTKIYQMELHTKPKKLWMYQYTKHSWIKHPKCMIEKRIELQNMKDVISFLLKPKL